MKKCPKIKDKPAPICAPTWLSRTDKRAFFAEIGRRSVGNCTLTADQVDTLADLVSARSRLAVLNRIWRRTLAEVKDGFRRDADLMGLAKETDRATASARRLAKALAVPSGGRAKIGGPKKALPDASAMAEQSNGAGLTR
jgi:hypothetical protein